MSDEDKRSDAQEAGTPPNAPFTPTPANPAPGWKLADEPIGLATGTPDVPPQLGDAINRVSHGWLRDRFALDEDKAGQLHVPDAQRWPDLGTRAEQFVKGLLQGIVQKTPEEKEAAMGLRDPTAVPRGTEVIGRLLSRFSNTVTDTWKDFVDEHAARETPGGKKVVDGEFVVQHGATLLGTMIERLGEAFQDVGAPGGEEVGPDFGAGKATPPEADQAAAAAAPEAGAVKPDDAAATPEGAAAKPASDIKVEVDLGSIFRALFSPRS